MRVANAQADGRNVTDLPLLPVANPICMREALFALLFVCIVVCLSVRAKLPRAMNGGLSDAALETARSPDAPWDFAIVDVVSARSFYANYHGHELQRLFSLHAHFRRAQRRVVWFAGDSSLGKRTIANRRASR